MNDSLNFPAIDRLIVKRRESSWGGSGFILAAPGSGRHIVAKEQIRSILRNTDDEVVVLDNMNQYTHSLAQEGYQKIKLSPYTGLRINPFDLVLSEDDEDNAICMKSDFIISLYSILCASPQGLSANQKSLVERCVRIIYEPLLNSKNEETGEYDYSLIPTMEDFYRVLSNQADFDALQMAQMLECYVEGSLNFFAHKTDIEHSNRLVIYEIQEFFSALMPMVLMVVLNHVWNRYVEAPDSQRKQKRIWIFIDETYPLFKTNDSLGYLNGIFKRAHKYCCHLTGITTHINTVTYANEGQFSILRNCDYLHLMNLPPMERKDISELLHLNEEQLSFQEHAAAYKALVYLNDTLFAFSHFLEIVKEYHRDSTGSWTETVEKDVVAPKKFSSNKLVERVEWLASIFRWVALSLICIGVLLPAVGTWVWDNNFGYACFALMGAGLLFVLGFGYCRFILREYAWNEMTDKE